MGEGDRNVTTANYIVLQQIIFHGYFLHVSTICIFPVLLALRNHKEKSISYIRKDP